MGKYDTDKIANIPIREVAERLGLRLKKRGKDYVTNCLWHNDEHPSMVVGGKINTCHCYSCEANYGVIELVKKALNADFLTSCEWLDNQGFNVALQRSTFKVQGSKIRKLEALQARNSIQSPLLERGIGGGSEGKASPQPSPKGEGVVYFKPEFLEGFINLNNSFARCLVSVFGEETATRVVKQYRLGSYELRYGYPGVMFPLIDKDGRIHDIKIQSYDCNPQSPTFFHKLDTCFWLKSVLLKQNPSVFISSPFGGLGAISLSGESKRGHLFGEHLLSLSSSSSLTIIIVESPKNACIGAAAYPEYLWLATGNKGMLKREVLEVLRGRKVAVFPDNDAFDEWNENLQEMQDIATFQCLHVPGDLGPKADIADWIIVAPQPPKGEG